jgi:putative DNA primase/helicase
MNDIDRIESALTFIDSSDRETWVNMGFAIQSELGDSGRELWMNWSREASSFKESTALSVWRSFRGSGVTLGTLLHEARQNGWRDEGYQRPSPAQLDARRKEMEERQSKEAQDRIRRGLRAAQKAEWILSQCQSETHAYLWSRGFPELQGLVWRPDDETNLLCIPMRIGGKLSSLQMIDKTGEKKFLTDGITAKAELVFDAHGPDWWTEGWANGWSLKLCLQALKMPYRIHVCFSAQNMKRLAHSGHVIADNDLSKTGEEAAKATGLSYWLADEVGTDFNDVFRKQGLFKTSQLLLKWINQNKRKAA